MKVEKHTAAGRGGAAVWNAESWKAALIQKGIRARVEKRRRQEARDRSILGRRFK
jgi:hypothetical protein